jgi:putative membrane protein
MFEAIRLYDRLLSEKKPGETFEVATIAGTELGGVTADRKLVAELNNLLETFTATEVILVSDGFSDEAVLPLIESRVPVHQFDAYNQTVIIEKRSSFHKIHETSR